MPSVIDPVVRHAASAPDSIAVRADPGDDWTYQQLLDGARTFGAQLHHLGAEPSERVVLIAPSVPEFVVAYLGIQVAGLVVVPMNTMSTADEVSYVLTDSGARAVIVWESLGEAARRAADAAAIPVVELGSMSPGGVSVGSVGLDTEQRDANATAAILYTSGTTGRPKGAELMIRNILAAGEISVEIGRSSADDRFGTGLPLFHIYGQISVMMTALTAGASLSLLSPFDAERMIELVRRERITVVAGVPTMWNAMLRAAEGFSAADFASVRVAVSGGASLPEEISRAFEERFGCPVLEGFGMTETTSLATFNDVDRGPKVGWAGAPVPRTSLEIRGADGTPLPAGEVGEIHLRGPSVMKGYWQRPEATAETLRDGWLRTGDLGQLDEAGDLRIVDRLKDLIIRGGYNVYPGEVEEVLYGHPDIVEVAVVGVPDDYYGEEVAAVVVLRDGARVSGPEVTAWARERMSAYKIPRVVRFVPELPRGATGKILKRAIDVAALD